MRKENSWSVNHVWQGLLLFGWVLHAALLWIYRTPPSLDYAHWLHQANVLAHYGDPGYDFERWYTIAGFFVPNGGFILPAALVAKMIPVEIAGKLILTLYCVLFPLSVRYMMKSFGDQSRRWMIAILLLFNISFVNGNIAFLTACTILFFAIGYLEKKERSAADVSVITLFALALGFAHAICAIAFLLYLTLRVLTPGTLPAERKWFVLWGSIIVIIAGIYIATFSGEESYFRFKWGLDARTRISMLSKSFVAGVTLPPYEFSFVRLAATLLLVLLTAWIFLRSVIASWRSSKIPVPIRAFFILMIAFALFAPKNLLGTIELSQRFIFIAFFCGLAMAGPDPGREKVLAWGIILAALFVLPVRLLEYAGSSAMLDARRDLIESTIPASEPVITFEDDLGSSNVPFGYLVPKGMSLMYQTDYNLTQGGYGPFSFRTGYILPRTNFFTTIDSLMRLRKEPGFLALRGIELPEDFRYVVLDFSSEFGSAMEERLAPVFAPVARKEIAPGIYTEILKRQKSFATARTRSPAGPAEDR